MTLSGIVSTKTSNSPGKFGCGLWSRKKVSQNTFKNTPEDDLDTFCDIISHLTIKISLFGTWKIAGPIRSGLVRTLTNTRFNVWIQL